MNIPAVKVFRLMHAWVIRTPVSRAYKECGVTKETAVDFYSSFREVAAVIVSNMQTQIGGPGMTVEVDETFGRRRKYNRGRLTSSHSLVILGIYCRETKEGLYWQVPGKSRKILWSYMLKYVAPGSCIMTDCAPQYRGCEELGLSFHKVVNHSKPGPGRFVDTEDARVHIQNIETRNRHLKDIIKRASTDEGLFLYISEFTYRERQFKPTDSNGQKFRRFLQDVGQVYPGPGREALKMKEVGIAPEDAMAGTFLIIHHQDGTVGADQTLGTSER